MEDAFVHAGIDTSTHEDETNEQLRTNKIVQFLNKKDNNKTNDIPPLVLFKQQKCDISGRKLWPVKGYNGGSDRRAEKIKPGSESDNNVCSKFVS